MRRWIGAIVCFLLASFVAATGQAAPDTYALRGTVITPTGAVRDGVVLVEHGKIAAVGTHLALPDHVTVVDTHGIIAPGFVDLHNHLTWNVFPRWHPAEVFRSRYDWQQRAAYQTLIESPHQALVADGVECAMERYAEVKALAEGETSVVGSLAGDCSRGLAHNLDVEPEWQLAYNVFPLQMTEAALGPVRAGLARHALHAFLIHLAEGTPRDASTAREFTMLKARGLLVPGVSLIHGGALTPADFAEMAAHGVGLIWSPRSNIELYGDTANVAAAKAATVRIALAPDWSPTGSDGTLAELNYASAWNEAQQPHLFSDAELVAMVTATPAMLVGQAGELGLLAPGAHADLLVLRADPAMAAHDAYWQLTHANAAQVMLVAVDGVPQYGEAVLLAKLGAGRGVENLVVCGVEKSVRLAGPEGHADAADVSWAQTTLTLSVALAHHGRALAPLAECVQ